jgi:hypothetical protein
MSDSRKAAVVGALHALQERLTAAHLAGITRDGGTLVHDFNGLLQQALEHFPNADTLRLIEPLHADAGMPVLAVRLVMMRRTLEASLVEGAPAPSQLVANLEAAQRRRSIAERRRWQRRDVEWPVQFLVGDGASVAAHAVDASRHGLRLVLDGPIPPGLLTHGQKCGVEVHLGGHSARFFRFAEVCHVDARGIGLTIPEALPAGLVPSGDQVAALPPPHRPDRADRVMRGLRSLFVALRGW